MALIPVCNEIEKVGLKINRRFIEEALKYENEEIKKAKEDFEKIEGRAFINSSKLFAEIFTARGESFPLTEKGNPSFKGDFLELLDSPTAKLINKIRHHEKRASTYWSSFLYFADHMNVLHPRLNQAGTVTGRFSSSNPNMQNMPKEDEEEDRGKKFLVRRAFIPREGMTFYSLDYSQLEYAIMLDYAGEKRLIEAINAGEDIHKATGSLLGISRKHAKTVNFGLLYGTGNFKLSKMLGVSEQEAKEIKQLYFAKLPKVRALIKGVTDRGSSRGFIYNWFGRTYWCGNYDFAYKLINYLIQGSASDLVKLAMVEIDLQIANHNMRLQTHDEIANELPEEREDIVMGMKKIMESVYIPKNGVQLKVKINKSKKSLANWDMEEFNVR